MGKRSVFLNSTLGIPEASLVRALRSRGYDVVSSSDVGLGGAPLEEQLNHANDSHRILVTLCASLYFETELAKQAKYGIIALDPNIPPFERAQKLDEALSAVNIDSLPGHLLSVT